AASLAATEAATQAAQQAATRAATEAATQAISQATLQVSKLAASAFTPAPSPVPLGGGAPVSAPQAPAEPFSDYSFAPSPESYQPQPAPQSFSRPAEEPRQTEDYGLPPMPRFDAHGRQVSGPQEATDLDQAGASLPPQFAANAGRPSWTAPEPERRSAPASTGSGQLRIDELARSIDIRTATEVWYRMRAGERGVLGRHIYTYEGQATFDEISARYDRDAEFRNTVDRYVADFERLLAEAEQSDPAGNLLQNYLTSETGRVYLLLAHASGRLR
ncbi:MAG: hypothetical protein KDJ72_09515, partial [Methyloceanibacter sp.]|nr:hypothetical protein [Methyloceanibacter sp.]